MDINENSILSTFFLHFLFGIQAQRDPKPFAKVAKLRREFAYSAFFACLGCGLAAETTRELYLHFVDTSLAYEQVVID